MGKESLTNRAEFRAFLAYELVFEATGKEVGPEDSWDDIVYYLCKEIIDLKKQLQEKEA